MKEEIFEKVYNGHRNLIIEGKNATERRGNILFPVVEHAIENGENLLIANIGEVYLNKYYEQLKAKNYNIIILNPNDPYRSEGWNPLEYPYKLYKNNNIEKAKEIMYDMLDIILNQTFICDEVLGAKELFLLENFILMLFEGGNENEIHIDSLIHMLNCFKDNKISSIGLSQKLKEMNKYVSRDTLYIYNEENSLREKLLLTILSLDGVEKNNLNEIEEYFHENIVDKRYFVNDIFKLRYKYKKNENIISMIRKTTFSIEEIINKPTAIFIFGRDEIISPIFINQLYEQLIDLKLNNRFNIVLNRYDNIESNRKTPDILGTSLDSNIKMYIETSSIEKLKNVFGDYISKLCDLLSIEDSKIKLKTDQNETTFDKEFEEVQIVSTNIEYPKLEPVEIKLFDFEKYIKEEEQKQEEEMKQRKEELLQRMEENNNYKSDSISYDADQLINKIDKRIEEIESSKNHDGGQQ